MRRLPTKPEPRSRDIKPLRLLALFLLVLAVGWRFLNVDGKVYWHDEAFTSTVITGRPGRYINQGLFTNQILKPADVLKFQQFQPDIGWQESLTRQAQEDAQHPPLYYLLLRGWAKVWGTSVAAIRSFSSWASLLIFPALFGLNLELFGSVLAAWLAIALFAVSPLQLVYAQEAREYSLWIAMVLANSWLFLRAMRLNGWRDWLVYGVSLGIGLNTALFTVLVMAGQGIYTLRLAKLGSHTQRLGLSWGLAAVLFLPWALRMHDSARHVAATTSWADQSLPLWVTLQAHVFNLSNSFMDFNFAYGNPWANAVALPFLLLQGWAIWVLCRQAPPRSKWFILTLIAGTALPLGLRDLIKGGQLLTVTRYLFPALIGLQLAVVYLLSVYWQQRRRLAVGLLAVILSVGIASCSTYSQANSWWNKVLNANYHQVAALINQSPQPLVIADAYSYNPASVIALSYLLKPNTDLLLLPSVNATMAVKSLPLQTQQVFLLNLPEIFRQQFAAKFQQKLTLVFSDPWNQVWAAKKES